jgi:MFS family permease
LTETFASTSKFTAQTFGAIAAAIATVSIVGVGLSLTVAVVAVRLEEMGYSARAIGLNPAAGGVATIAWAPFVPLFARRFGTRLTLVLALLVGILSLAAFAVTDDYWSWLLLRMVFGATLTTLFVISEYWINAAAPAGQRGFVMGLYTTTLAVGFATGPLILLVSGINGPEPFIIGIALFIIAIMPIYLNRTKAEIERPPDVPVLGFFFKTPVATLASLLHGAIETAAMSLLPVYAIRLGLPVESGAILLGVFLTGNILFQIPIGLLSDRMDRQKLLAIITIGGIVGALALPFAATEQFSLFCAGLILWGGFVGGFYAVGLAHLGSRYHGAELASANAAYVMFYSFGMLIGPPIIGFGLDLLPPNGFFLATALILVPYLCLLFYSRKRTHS